MPQTLIDHDSIRRWADQHGARPARVRGTGDEADPGILRLDFEGYSGEDSLDEIDWDEWFRKFDDSGLALLIDNSGRSPNFNKLVRRDADAADSMSRRRTPGPRRDADSGGSSTSGRGTAPRDAAGGDESVERRGRQGDDDETFDEDEDEFDEDEFDEDDETADEENDRDR
jgi:hypothetical protein